MKITYYDNKGNVSEVKDFGEIVDPRVLEYNPEDDLFSISDEKLDDITGYGSFARQKCYIYRFYLLRVFLRIDYQNYIKSPYFENIFGSNNACCNTHQDYDKNLHDKTSNSVDEDEMCELYRKVFGIRCSTDISEWRSAATKLVSISMHFVSIERIRNNFYYSNSSDIEPLNEKRRVIEALFPNENFDFDVFITIKRLGRVNRQLVYSLISTLENDYIKATGKSCIFENLRKEPSVIDNCKHKRPSKMYPMTMDFTLQEIGTCHLEGEGASLELKNIILDGLQTEYKQFCTVNAEWIRRERIKIVGDAQKYIKNIDLTTDEWRKYYFHYRELMNITQNFYIEIVHQYDKPDEFINLNDNTLLFYHILELEAKGDLQDDRIELYKEMVKINFIKEKMGVVKGKVMRPVFDDLLKLSMAKIDDIRNESYQEPYKGSKIYNHQEVIKDIKDESKKKVLTPEQQDGRARAIVFLEPLFGTDKYINEKCWPYGGPKLRRYIYDLLRGLYSDRILDRPNVWGFNLKLIYNIIGILSCRVNDEKYLLLKDLKGANYTKILENERKMPSSMRVNSRVSYINQNIKNETNESKGYSCLDKADKKDIEAFIQRAIAIEKDNLL